MYTIVRYFNRAYNTAKSALVDFYYNQLVNRFWPYENSIRLWWILLALLAVIILVTIIIASANKKYKIHFFVGSRRYKSIKVKFKKEIVLPETPKREGFEFVCWCKDKTLKEPFISKVLEEKKALSLHAYFKPAEIVDILHQGPLQEPTVIQNGGEFTQQQAISLAQQNVMLMAQQNAMFMAQQQAMFMAQQQSNFPQGVGISMPIQDGAQYYYDEIRYTMLGYERAPQFKKLGVVSKQIIAEMFEKDGAVYLYLAVDPNIMQAKGYNVSKYDDEQFSIVPCKKVVKSKEDLDEALQLVKEVMTINNLIKSGAVTLQRPVSTEQSRKSGFAFFVKNEVVASSADDYYRLLRAVVLSYKMKAGVKIPDSAQNKMILKIYKKEQTVFVYLALDPASEGLVSVSYDKNFIDTPAMVTINTYEDCLRANELIDKLMFTYGMQRCPEKAEISLEDPIAKNCGFGYRIKN